MTGTEAGPQKLVEVLEAERERAVENVRRLNSLRGRLALLEKLSGVQRMISQRAPLDAVLEGIASGVSQLLGDSVGVLQILDEDNPGFLRTAACAGVQGLLDDDLCVVPLDQGIAGRAFIHDRTCTANAVPYEASAFPATASSGRGWLRPST